MKRGVEGKTATTMVHGVSRSWHLHNYITFPLVRAHGSFGVLAEDEGQQLEGNSAPPFPSNPELRF